MNADAFTRFLKAAVVADSAGQDKGKIYGRGDTVPADAATGWAKGALFIQTDGAAGTCLYVNEGSVTSADFNAANDTGAYLPLAGGTMDEGADIALGTTTGSKIGTAVTQKLGFWNVTPVVQPVSADQAALTDSSGGTADGTIAAVSGSGADADINNNFAEVATLLNQLRNDLVTVGIIKGSA